MNIQELLGEAYKEGMSVEEINTALAGKTFVDPSTLPPSVPKDTFDKTAKDLAAAKKRVGELESANLSEDEKLKNALADAQATKDEYTRKSIRLDVEKVLVQGGLSEKEYESIIDTLVSTDKDASIALANNLINIITGQKKTAADAVKAEMQKDLKDPPKGREGDGKVTKEEYDKMTYSEQLAYMEAHPDAKFD